MLFGAGTAGAAALLSARFCTMLCWLMQRDCRSIDCSFSGSRSLQPARPFRFGVSSAKQSRNYQELGKRLLRHHFYRYLFIDIYMKNGCPSCIMFFFGGCARRLVVHSYYVSDGYAAVAA